MTRNLFTGQQFGDESFEDGLVLENPRVELSNGRLSRNKRARGANGPTARKTSGGKEKTEREKAWEKSREQGWGRVTPLPLPTRGSGFRSHSATTTALTGSLREKDASRLRASLDAVAMPPPPNAAPAATTPSRLRHQKSHYNMGPPPSPSSTLTRKQSLASLQDSLPSPTSSAPELRTPARYHYSSSRLTLPTASSLARTRAPVRGIFPESSSASSMSTSGSGQIAAPKSGRGGRNLRRWNGKELEGIEDLVDASAGKPARRGKSHQFCNWVYYADEEWQDQGISMRGQSPARTSLTT